MGLALISALAAPGSAQHDHQGHAAHRPGPTEPPGDGRLPVRFPGPLKEHTLANMRDHLLALQEIQAALGAAHYDHAADLAEQRLGMSSLPLHGAHEVAKYMPEGMRAAGTAMHRSASRFAIAAKDVAATGEVRGAVSALAELTGTCVACHAAFRLE